MFVCRHSSEEVYDGLLAGIFYDSVCSYFYIDIFMIM